MFTEVDPHDVNRLGEQFANLTTYSPDSHLWLELPVPVFSLEAGKQKLTFSIESSQVLVFSYGMTRTQRDHNFRGIKGVVELHCQNVLPVVIEQHMLAAPRLEVRVFAVTSNNTVRWFMVLAKVASV